MSAFNDEQWAYSRAEAAVLSRLLEEHGIAIPDNLHQLIADQVAAEEAACEQQDTEDCMLRELRAAGISDEQLNGFIIDMGFPIEALYSKAVDAGVVDPHKSPWN